MERESDLTSMAQRHIALRKNMLELTSGGWDNRATLSAVEDANPIGALLEVDKDSWYWKEFQLARLPVPSVPYCVGTEG